MLRLLVSALIIFASVPVCNAQIRNMDWKNFTYPWYPADARPPYSARKITLVNGEFVVYADSKRKIENLSISFDNVSYAELTGDGREEAIVYISGTETFNSFTGCIFVYTMSRGRLRLLWKHQTGDRGMGGLKDLKVVNRELVVEQYEDNRCMACTDHWRRTLYRWNGRRFRITKSQVFP
jgi:hypothetical protein